MRMTKLDYKRRVRALADGTSADPDDDRRLVKLYESTGAEHEETHVVALDDSAQGVDNPVQERPSARKRAGR